MPNLQDWLLRKTVINKLALAVGAMIEAQTPNTIELANVLPVPTKRQEIREQWRRRLLKNPLLDSPGSGALAAITDRRTEIICRSGALAAITGRRTRGATGLIAARAPLLQRSTSSL